MSRSAAASASGYFVQGLYVIQNKLYENHEQFGLELKQALSEDFTEIEDNGNRHLHQLKFKEDDKSPLTSKDGGLVTVLRSHASETIEKVQIVKTLKYVNLKKCKIDGTMQNFLNFCQ